MNEIILLGPKLFKELNDQLILFSTEIAVLQIRAEVVDPAEAAALAAAVETGQLRQGLPVGVTVVGNEVDELLVFLSRPWPFLHLVVVLIFSAAWWPRHLSDRWS